MSREAEMGTLREVVVSQAVEIARLRSQHAGSGAPEAGALDGRIAVAVTGPDGRGIASGANALASADTSRTELQAAQAEAVELRGELRRAKEELSQRTGESAWSPVTQEQYDGAQRQIRELLKHVEAIREASGCDEYVNLEDWVRELAETQRRDAGAAEDVVDRTAWDHARDERDEAREGRRKAEHRAGRLERTISHALEALQEAGDGADEAIRKTIGILGGNGKEGRGTSRSKEAGEIERARKIAGCGPDQEVEDRMQEMADDLAASRAEYMRCRELCATHPNESVEDAIRAQNERVRQTVEILREGAADGEGADRLGAINDAIGMLTADGKDGTSSDSRKGTAEEDRRRAQALEVVIGQAVEELRPATDYRHVGHISTVQRAIQILTDRDLAGAMEEPHERLEEIRMRLNAATWDGILPAIDRMLAADSAAPQVLELEARLRREQDEIERLRKEIDAGVTPGDEEQAREHGRLRARIGALEARLRKAAEAIDEGLELDGVAAWRKVREALGMLQADGGGAGDAGQDAEEGRGGDGLIRQIRAELGEAATEGIIAGIRALKERHAEATFQWNEALLRADELRSQRDAAVAEAAQANAGREG